MSRSSQRSTIKDMTNGNPAKLILGFAVPMLMGLLFQQFYSMVDTIIVGKFLGVDALASVGSTSAINFMINGFVIGVCTGFSIPVAQRFGAQDYKDMRRFVANAGWVASCFAVIMTVIVCLMTRQILVWMQTPDNIIDGAYSYIFFVFAGIPATYLYNTLAGIIRALGDSKTPVYFLILSSLLNIALDLLLIVQIGTGTAGAAYATVISQAVSGILCLIYMKKKFEILHMHREETRISGRHIYILCKMGVPMGLQYSITAIGSVVIQTAINSLGSIAVASVTAGQKIGMFFCCPFDALGGTMATYAGQNAGAGKVDRIRQGVRSATLIGGIYSIAACIVLTVFGGVIPLLFVDASETVVIHQAHQFLTFNSLFYIPLTIVNVWRFTIQGMGYSLLAILAGVCEMIARAMVGFLLVPIFGYIIIWAGIGGIAWPTEMLIACSFDRKLWQMFGDAVGKECEDQQVNVWLAPAVNLHRNPLCGRNFEYFSEDPYLTGVCACEITKGVQNGRPVIVCPKHFAANEQETFRRGNAGKKVDAVDSILTERSARELYLKPFEMLVREAHIACIMTSFNKINGVFAGGSKDLCTRILREEWGFDGAVVTDWGDMDIVVDGADAVAAGNDIVMPGGPPVIRQILKGYEEGRVTREEMETAAGHLLCMIRRIHGKEK